jgi:hypothetical protein
MTLTAPQAAIALIAIATIGGFLFVWLLKPPKGK